MKLSGVMMLAGALLIGSPLYAAAEGWNVGTGHQAGSGQGNSSGANTDVVVDLPPEVWTQGQNSNQPPCQRCCTYENRSYTEGSVVKMEGVLLQCARDGKSFGTNNLIWQTIK